MSGVPAATVGVLCERVRELEAIAFRQGDRVWEVDSDREGEVVRVERRGELVRVLVSYPDGIGRKWHPPIGLEIVEPGISLEAFTRMCDWLRIVPVGRSVLEDLRRALGRLTRGLDRKVASCMGAPAESIASRDLDAWYEGVVALERAARTLVQRTSVGRRVRRVPGAQHGARVQARKSRRMSVGGRKPSRMSRGMRTPAVSASNGAVRAKTPGKRRESPLSPTAGGAPSSGTKKKAKAKSSQGNKRAEPGKSVAPSIAARRATRVHPPKGGG